MAVSALAAGAAGAGSLLQGVAAILPQGSSTKGRTNTKASATSETSGGQLDLSKMSTSNIGTSSNDTVSKNDVNSSQLRTSLGSENTQSTTNATTNTKNVEEFSGQQNTSSSQTLIDEEGIMRIMNMALGGEGGIAGLQELVSGERSAGLFNSSTNQLLVSDLLTRVSGEAARLGAKTVQDQNLGKTSTVNTGKSSTITDAVTNAMSRLTDTTRGFESSRGSESSTGRTQNQENTDAGSISLAQQLVQQESESETNNKSKTKSGIFGGCFLTTMVVQGLGKADDCIELETLRLFRDTWLAANHPEAITAYYAEAPAVVAKLSTLPRAKFLDVIEYFYHQYIMPVIFHIRLREYPEAYEKYNSMIANSKELAATLGE